MYICGKNINGKKIFVYFSLKNFFDILNFQILKSKNIKYDWKFFIAGKINFQVLEPVPVSQ